MLDYDTIKKGMDIYDMNGDKVGSVGEIRTPSGVVGTSAAGAGAATTQGAIKTDTGFLGLGKDFYIPFDAIRDIRGDGVHLNLDKKDMERMNWDKKPTWWS